MTGGCELPVGREPFTGGRHPAGSSEPPGFSKYDRRPTLNLSEERAGRQKEVIVAMSTVTLRHTDADTWASALAAALEFLLGEGPFPVDPRAAEKVARETLVDYHAYVAWTRRPRTVGNGHRLDQVHAIREQQLADRRLK